MLFFEVIKSIFRFTPNNQNELTKTTLDAEKKPSSGEVAIVKSRVSVLERPVSGPRSQEAITECNGLESFTAHEKFTGCLDEW